MSLGPLDPQQRFVRLAAVLRAEMLRMDRLVSEADRAAADFGARAPVPLELRGLGDILHDFYTGAERIFERIAPALNGGLPETRSWHRDLLESMAMDLPGVRPPVVRDETVRALDDYLRFRHVFRNMYGYELEWGRLRPLLDAISGTWRALRDDLTTFLSFVDSLAGQGGS